MVKKMKKGFWNSIGKVPVLVLAVAVGPVAMADGPSAQSGSARATSGPEHAIRTDPIDRDGVQ
jgi:hypothetical protein